MQKHTVGNKSGKLIKKNFTSLKQAEAYQLSLYNKYESVKITKTPLLFSESGEYLWLVSNWFSTPSGKQNRPLVSLAIENCANNSKGVNKMTEMYEPTLEIFSEGETYEFLLQKISSKIEHYEAALEGAEIAKEKAEGELHLQQKFVEKLRDILYQAEKDFANLETVFERQSKEHNLKR